MTGKRVRDVMSSPVVAVLADAGFKEIVAVLIEMSVSAMPVVDAGSRVLGVVSETDLLHKEEVKEVAGPVRGLVERRARRTARAKAAADTAADLMTSPAVTVAPDAPVPVAARLLDEHGITRLPVVEDGRLVGIVSRCDLLGVFLRTDEQIRDEVITEVIEHALWEDPADVAVEVTDGVVTLSGRVGLKSLTEYAVRLTAAVDGVVDVADKLTYGCDRQIQASLMSRQVPAQRSGNPRARPASRSSSRASGWATWSTICWAWVVASCPQIVAVPCSLTM